MIPLLFRGLLWLCVLLSVASHSSPADGGLPTPLVAADSVIREEIRSGVVHTTIYDARGPWAIHILEMNLRDPDLSLESARAFDRSFGRERTSSMARRKTDRMVEVVAALNADFFNLRTGETENNQVIDGETVKGTKLTGSPFDTFDNIHSQFGTTFDKKPLLDRLQFVGTITWANASFDSLDGVNDTPSPNRFILFTHFFGDATPPDTTDLGIEELPLRILEIKSDTVYARVTDRSKSGGRTDLVEGTLVLAAYGHDREVFERVATKGEMVRIWLGWRPSRGKVKTLVGGWPRTVLNGKNIASYADSLEGTFPRFSANRHPRSGVGFSRDSTTVYFITVDGRQESSVGMSLVEFADLMITVGVYQGLNLDGGGSTTLIVNGRIVNSPSDPSGERPVGNCLLLIARRK